MKKIATLAIMLIFATTLVYATFEIERPTASEYIKGVYVINGSAIDAVGADNCSNITVDYRISGGSTYTVIGYNTTGGAGSGSGEQTNITGNWSVSFSTYDVSDNGTYSVRARCLNSSNDVLATATEVAFNIDNGVPNTVTLVSPENEAIDKDGDVTFSYTAINATAMTLMVDGSAYSMSKSSETYTYTLSDMSGGYHTWYVVASDGLNFTQSSSTKVGITLSSGGLPLDANGQPVMATTATTVPGGKIGGVVKQLIELPFKIIGAVIQPLINMLKG